MATTTVEHNFSLSSLQSVSRLQEFVKPLLPTITKLVQVGKEYYSIVKRSSRSTTQVLDVVEKVVETTSEKVQTQLQVQVNRNARNLEWVDKYGVQVLERVEQGKARVERVLLRPALFVLSLLTHVSFVLKGSRVVEESSEVDQTTSTTKREAVEEELVSTEERTLTETYKLVGQRTLELGPELVQFSKKRVEQLKVALDQIPLVAQLTSKLLFVLKPSRCIVDERELQKGQEEKKEN